MTQTIFLTGISGRSYEYAVYPVNADWLNVPGNYAMIDRNMTPKYIGETVDFSSRRPGPSHDKWSEAERHGAILIAAHANHGGETARKAEEADLIRAYNPPANIQHRLSAALLSRRRGFGLGG